MAAYPLAKFVPFYYKSIYPGCMRSDERETAPQAGYICPACNGPVTAEIKRHKTMGVFVPVWKPGPCHNRSCPKYVPGDKSPGSSGPEQ